MSAVAAALVPGMPQLLAREPAPSWAELAAATREVGQRLRALDVQTVLLLSTQWFTVLGHQVQCDARLRGARTDENWYRYDYGHLTHDLRVDVELAHAWADAIDSAGMQARRTRYDGFPIDTGTVTASRLLDPSGAGRWAMVSCNLYADPSAMVEVARAGVRAAGDRRVAVLAVSGLSSGSSRDGSPLIRTGSRTPSTTGGTGRCWTRSGPATTCPGWRRSTRGPPR